MPAKIIIISDSGFVVVECRIRTCISQAAEYVESAHEIFLKNKI